MITRVSQLRIDPARASEAERLVRDEFAPAVLAQPGAQAGQWMVDRGTGEVLAVVRWADDDAMLAAGSALAPVRDAVVTALRATPTSVQIHQVVGLAVERALTLDADAWSHTSILAGVDDSRRADAAALFRIVAEQHESRADHLGTTWTADFSTETSIITSTWATLDALRADVGSDEAVRAEIVRALSAAVVSQGERRTVGATPEVHVIDLTAFDRVPERLSK